MLECLQFYERLHMKKGQETVSVGDSGALSSGKSLPFWQAPLSLMESYARRALEGTLPKENREPYPIHNWRTGLNDPLFIRDRYNHFIKHAMKLGNGIEDSEDNVQGNIDAITWFAGFINEAVRLHPEAVADAFYSDPRGEKFK